MTTYIDYNSLEFLGQEHIQQLIDNNPNENLVVLVKQNENKDQLKLNVEIRFIDKNEFDSFVYSLKDCRLLTHKIIFGLCVLNGVQVYRIINKNSVEQISDVKEYIYNHYNKLETNGCETFSDYLKKVLQYKMLSGTEFASGIGKTKAVHLLNRYKSLEHIAVLYGYNSEDKILNYYLKRVSVEETNKMIEESKKNA